MTNDQNTKTQDITSLKEQIQALMAEVEKTGQENAVVNKQMADEMASIKKEVDDAAEGVEKDLAELDTIEKETNNALDKIILEQAEDAGDDDL